MCMTFMLIRGIFFFFFNDTATTEIYTLSLHDALPIFYTLALPRPAAGHGDPNRWLESVGTWQSRHFRRPPPSPRDRKSTRLNSSHANISYAVFCLKKKKIILNLPSIHSINLN